MNSVRKLMLFLADSGLMSDLLIGLKPTRALFTSRMSADAFKNKERVL